MSILTTPTSNPDISAAGLQEQPQGEGGIFEGQSGQFFGDQLGKLVNAGTDRLAGEIAGDDMTRAASPTPQVEITNSRPVDGGQSSQPDPARAGMGGFGVSMPMVIAIAAGVAALALVFASD